jgi:hypothetical protein
VDVSKYRIIIVGMAGSSEYFLNSSGYVYGYMTLKGVLVIEYLIGKFNYFPMLINKVAYLFVLF